MENRKWQMNENFVFPASAGVPVGAESIKVTPGFTEERTEDAVRLTGIYHIASNVNFDEGESVVENMDSAVLIDDIDLKGNSGYFEYAIPLNIDLPPEAASPLNVETANVKVETDGQGSFGVVWDVKCSYQESVLKAEEIEVEVVVPKQASEPVSKPVTKPASKQVSKPVLESVSEQVAEAMPEPAENVTFTDQNNPLTFVAGLSDGISSKTFRLNDVFVENKS